MAHHPGDNDDDAKRPQDAKTRTENRRQRRKKGLKNREIWLDYYTDALLLRLVKKAGFTQDGEKTTGISAVLTQAIRRYAGKRNQTVIDEEEEQPKLAMLKAVWAAEAQHRLDQGESVDDIKKDWNKLPSRKNPFREPDDERNWTRVGLNTLIRLHGPKGRKALTPKTAKKAGIAERSSKKK